MRTLFLLLCAVVALGAQQPPDPNRPWMRCEPPGCPEISCASPHAIERFKKDNPARRIEACECQHQCNPLDPNAGITDDRTWDPRCRAACNPANCTCQHPCES